MASKYNKPYVINEVGFKKGLYPDPAKEMSVFFASASAIAVASIFTLSGVRQKAKSFRR